MDDTLRERALRDFIVEESLAELEPLLDEWVNREDIEPALWEATAASVRIDAEPDAADFHRVLGDDHGWESVKAANVRYNVAELGEAVAASALAVGAAVSTPVLAPAAVLAITLTVRRAATVDLSLEDAVVYATIYRHSNPGTVSRGEVERRAPATVDDLDVMANLDERVVRDSIDMLARIDAIDVIDDGDGERYRALEECDVIIDEENLAAEDGA